MQITDRVTVFPFNKVHKQLANAQGDSVLGLFTSIPALLKRPDAGAAQAPVTDQPGKRPWWKWW